MNPGDDPPELTPDYLRSVWARLAPHIHPTLFVHKPMVDQALGANATLACESLQHTGSFKFRGAYSLVSSIPNQRIVSASSGNFGQALARACRLLDRFCTVVMPDSSAEVKVQAVERYGARVEMIDTRHVRRLDRVRELMAEDPDAFYAPAYDDPRVIAGNSSLGREIFEHDSYDAVVVPIGGGGLISGIISARDALGLLTPIFGAEPALGNDAARSLHSGQLVANEAEPPTIADGARTLSLGDYTWPIVRAGVEDIVEVPENRIAEGVRLLFQGANLKAEPTGALAVAAAALVAPRLAGKRICCVVSGGNVDDLLYAAILRGEM